MTLLRKTTPTIDPTIELREPLEPKRIDIGRTPADMMNAMMGFQELNESFILTPGLIDLPPPTGLDDEKFHGAILSLQYKDLYSKILISTHAPNPPIHAIYSYKAANPILKV